MGELIYRDRSPSLAHEYVSRYKDKTSSATRRTSGYLKTKPILGRNNSYGNYRKPTGGYASENYDPVARHERYLRERSSLGIGKGRSGGSGGSGGSGRGSGKGSGRGGRGASKANLAKEIAKLREESNLNTEAQREAARRKIEDLRNEIKKQAEKLRNRSEGEELNAAEIRGKIQSIKKKIEATGGNLQEWITNERDALERRIAALYKAKGIDYKPKLQKDKTKASKARDKEVKRRADSIYKSKSKK